MFFNWVFECQLLLFLNHKSFWLALYSKIEISSRAVRFCSDIIFIFLCRILRIWRDLSGCSISLYFLYRTFSSGRIKWTMQSEKGLGAGKGVGHLCFWDVKGNQTGVFWVHLDSGQMLRGHQGIFLLCKGHVYGKPIFPVIRNLIITMIMETCSLLCRLQTTISLWLQDANVGNSATGKFQGATRQWPGAPEAMTRVALVKHHGRRTQNRVG